MSHLEGFVILCAIILGLVIILNIFSGWSPKKPIQESGIMFKLPEKLKPKYNATRLCGRHIILPIPRKKLVILDDKNCDACKKELKL